MDYWLDGMFLSEVIDRDQSGMQLRQLSDKLYLVKSLSCTQFGFAQNEAMTPPGEEEITHSEEDNRPDLCSVTHHQAL